MNELEYQKQLHKSADVFKALAHPIRVCIVNKLATSNLNVTQMMECLEASQSNISQHLTILKHKGIIEGNRNGSEVIYSLIDEDVRKMVKLYFD